MWMEHSYICGKYLAYMAIIFFKNFVLLTKVQFIIHKIIVHVHTLNGNCVGQNVDLMWSQSNHAVVMQL
jgi:hypothetical protein